MDLARTTNWSAGSNNIAKPERLPDASVVSAVNVDATVGGKLELRTGFELALAGANVRGLFAAGRLALLVDGSTLIAYEPETDTAVALAQIAATGPIAAAHLNGVVYFNSLLDSLRFDGVAVSPWAVQAPVFDVQLVAGALPAGLYKIAVTATDSGLESGALPIVVKLDGSQALRISSADPRQCTVYCSATDSKTLYRQGELFAGVLRISYVIDDTVRLQTGELTPLPFCDQLCAHGSMIVGSTDKVLRFTEPMWPHLHNPLSGFVQFDAPIMVQVSVGSGLFVATTRATYFITGVGTPEIAIAHVNDIGAVRGTALQLPSKQACWFTPYGQAIGSPDGAVTLSSKDSYAPDTAAVGASGMVEHNGNQMVITSMRGETAGNGLRAGDFSELEII